MTILERTHNEFQEVCASIGKQRLPNDILIFSSETDKPAVRIQIDYLTSISSFLRRAILEALHGGRPLSEMSLIFADLSYSVIDNVVKFLHGNTIELSAVEKSNLEDCLKILQIEISVSDQLCTICRTPMKHDADFIRNHYSEHSSASSKSYVKKRLEISKAAQVLSDLTCPGCFSACVPCQDIKEQLNWWTNHRVTCEHKIKAEKEHFLSLIQTTQPVIETPLEKTTEAVKQVNTNSKKSPKSAIFCRECGLSFTSSAVRQLHTCNSILDKEAKLSNGTPRKKVSKAKQMEKSKVVECSSSLQAPVSTLVSQGSIGELPSGSVENGEKQPKVYSDLNQGQAMQSSIEMHLNDAQISQDQVEQHTRFEMIQNEVDATQARQGQDPVQLQADETSCDAGPSFEFSSESEDEAPLKEDIRPPPEEVTSLSKSRPMPKAAALKRKHRESVESNKRLKMSSNESTESETPRRKPGPLSRRNKSSSSTATSEVDRRTGSTDQPSTAEPNLQNEIKPKIDQDCGAAQDNEEYDEDHKDTVQTEASMLSLNCSNFDYDDDLVCNECNYRAKDDDDFTEHYYKEHGDLIPT